MKRTLLSVLASLALAVTISACSSPSADTASAPATADDPKAVEWCESFKRMENSTHLVERAQVYDDSLDPALSDEERDAAAVRYQELLALPPNDSTVAECTGPVWDRFYEETLESVQSKAAIPAPTTTVSPEQALYVRYTDALNAAGIAFRPGAGLGSGSFSSDQTICGFMRDGILDAYALAGREGVAAQDDNGRRIVTMVPILCPDQQPLIDEALSGNAVMETFIDGQYIVGGGYNPTGPRLVAPGTYTTGLVSDCYWERSDSQGNIIDNNLVSISQGVTVTIAASDGAFTSRGCGPWTLAG